MYPGDRVSGSVGSDAAVNAASFVWAKFRNVAR